MKRHFAISEAVYVVTDGAVNIKVASCSSIRWAKRIANALNLYRPKVRRRSKSAEKAVNSRP